jgi:hypothetical protein
MDFQVEKYVSTFVRSQFPAFYNEEGENFILFMKAYYEWAEQGSPDGHISQTGGFISESRDLMNYRDIDNTLTNFLEFFQRKYLYGIPFNVISNKRFLLKHILDVYRSKGTIQCYRLLFKLLYDKDIEIYLPGNDILRPSDGNWVEPRYIEVTQNDNLQLLIGKTIIGASSGTTAIVENYVKESHDKDILNIIYLSNILPRGGNFTIGEKVIVDGQVGNTVAVSSAPTVLGSLDNLSIINGGQGFNIGDVIKIAHNNLSNGNVISYGTEGTLKVIGLSKAYGSLNFDIEDGGFGFLANAQTFIYRNDTTGNYATFSVASVANTQLITYNTDIICDYANLTLNSVSFGFPANSGANLSSNIGLAFSYTNDIFGTITSLGGIDTGNGYTQPANVFVRSCQFSKILPGNVSYNTSSNTITGTNTIFTSIYSNNDVIYLQANSSMSSTIELAVIRTVTNATSMVLYGPPSINSTSSAKYRAAPVILPSSFASYEPYMATQSNILNGLNEVISANPASGNNTIAKVTAINSGKGYVDGEIIKAYLYSGVSTTFDILSGGLNYANGEILIFSGGNAGKSASGYISTNTSGGITSATLISQGSGYETTPSVSVKTANGSGASLRAYLTEYNTTSTVTARVIKSGVGRSKGFWNTTRGFLNSDKYIQDSYYYQDYSYEIKVAETLDKYKNILYDTFHSAGSELFGKYLSIDTSTSQVSVLEESIFYTAVYSDSGLYTADNNFLTVDNG